MTERLQKIISQAGIASRREAEKMIAAGRVAVNGATVTELGSKVNPARDKITVDGTVIAGEKHVYIMLYKPKGVVSTLRDPQGRKTVVSYISGIAERIYPVGRLDYNTEGLLLLTNDGELTHALIHPSRKINKTYVAKITGIAQEEKLDLLRAGIVLPEDGMTAPAQINIVQLDRTKNLTTVEVIIHEGKNRQIRRMFEQIGYPVEQLKRTHFAFLSLTGLRRGQYRHLTEEEVTELKS